MSFESTIPLRSSEGNFGRMISDSDVEHLADSASGPSGCPRNRETPDSNVPSPPSPRGQLCNWYSSNKSEHLCNRDCSNKHTNSPALVWAPDPRWAGGSGIEPKTPGQPATLEFWVRFPNERNQGKQAHPASTKPGSSRVQAFTSA
jgi:hypothetical protein